MRRRGRGKKSQIKLASIILALSLLTFVVLALNSTNTAENITNFIANWTIEPAQENITSNITENITEQNQTQTNITANQTEETNIRENIAQEEQAVIGKPVKWKVKIKALTFEAAQEKLPKKSSLISGMEISPETYDFEYETPAPKAVEEQVSDTRKQITISAPSELNYTNIIAYTHLEKEAPENRVKLYHLVNESRELVNITKYDLNNNSLIDYIEWIVPSLSSQTYELIIEISKAEHLDENKNLIEDVYELVKEKDNIWKLIPSQHYLRVTFNRNLTDQRDITIYARRGNVSMGNNSVPYEIYEKKKRIDEIKKRLEE